MARTSLSDVDSLPDPLLSYNFDLVFPVIPGGGNTRQTTIKCMSTQLPGMQLEQQTAGLHGVEVSYAGRQVYTKTFTATYIETRDATTRKDFKRWMRVARNNRTNRGSYKSQYATTPTLYLYDDLPQIVETNLIRGCFPIDVQDVEMDGGAGTIVQVTITFSYDSVDDL